MSSQVLVEIETNGCWGFEDLTGAYWYFDSTNQFAIRLKQSNGKDGFIGNMWTYDTFYQKPDGMLMTDSGPLYYEITDAFQAARSLFNGTDVWF